MDNFRNYLTALNTRSANELLRPVCEDKPEFGSVFSYVTMPFTFNIADILTIRCILPSIDNNNPDGQRRQQLDLGIGSFSNIPMKYIFKEVTKEVMIGVVNNPILYDFVGYVLSLLRPWIPNFELVFGRFDINVEQAGNMLFAGFGKYYANVLLLESQGNALTLGAWLTTGGHNQREFWELLLQLVGALLVAWNTCAFCHNGLNEQVLTVRSLAQPLTIRYYDSYITTNNVLIIGGFDNSAVTYNNRRFTNGNEQEPLREILTFFGRLATNYPATYYIFSRLSQVTFTDLLGLFVSIQKLAAEGGVDLSPKETVFGCKTYGSYDCPVNPHRVDNISDYHNMQLPLDTKTQAGKVIENHVNYMLTIHDIVMNLYQQGADSNPTLRRAMFILFDIENDLGEIVSSEPLEWDSKPSDPGNVREEKRLKDIFSDFDNPVGPFYGLHEKMTRKYPGEVIS